MQIYYPESPKNRWYKQSFSVQKLPFAAAVSVAAQTPREKDAAFEALREKRKGKSMLEQIKIDMAASKEAKEAAKKAAAQTVKDSTGKTYKPPQPLELEDIVKTLEAGSFSLAAKLYKKWFAGSAYAGPTGGAFRSANVDGKTVTHDYLLGYERYKKAFEYIRSEDFLGSSEVLDSLKKYFAELPDCNLDTENDFSEDLQKAHKKYAFASIRVGHHFPHDYQDVRLELVNKSDLWVDDLELALGEFRLFVAIDEARCVTVGQVRHVTIKSVYVYGMSTFAPAKEKADPYLGHWSKKHIALIPNGRDGWLKAPAYKGTDPSDSSSIYWPVTGQDFGKWREQHQQGGDLVLFTERRRPRIENITFQLGATEDIDDSDAFTMVLTPLQLSAMLEGGTIEQEGTGPSTTTRLWGAAQMIGGALEMVGGGALLMVPEPTMITKAGGVLAVAHGSDDLTTGWKQLLSGRDQMTYTAQSATHTAESVGISPEKAMLIGMTLDMGASMGVGSLAGAAKVKTIRKGIANLEAVEDIKLGGKLAGGGHTIYKHVNATEAYLRSRLVGTTMKAATSFKTLEEANLVVSRAMAFNRKAIRGWAKAAKIGDRQEFYFDAGKAIGYGVVRATGLMKHDFTRLRVVLKRMQVDNKSYFVLTAHPVL